MRALWVWSLRLLLLIVAVLVAAVMLAPAKLVLMAAERWAPQIQMSEPTGTIWQGESNQVAVDVGGTTLQLGKLSWELSLLSVLSAKPSLNLVVDAPEHRARAQVSATREQVITVDNVEGSFPLSLLEPWVPLLVKGDLAFVVDHVVFNLHQRELLAVDGALNLQQADWVGGDVEMPLGSYIAQVSLADNKDIMIQLNDFSATLGIDGLITVNQTGSYHFNAALQTRDGLAPEVAQSVSWFGKKNADGDIIVNRRGRWN